MSLVGFSRSLANMVVYGLLAELSLSACGMSDSAPPVLAAGTYTETERAVIIWDEAHHLEHFIRQADFHVKDADLGFLVPTPTAPQIADASDGIFDLADQLGASAKTPHVDVRSPWQTIAPLLINPLLRLDRLSFAALNSGFSALTGATALSRAQFASARYQATILDASDEVAVRGWFRANHFIATPELLAWLRQYALAKWKITAFHLIKPDESPSLQTAAVRLSFTTDRPFYPYSEPSDRQSVTAASPAGRVLSLSVVSNQRMTPALADNSNWPGRLEFAGPSTTSASAVSSRTAHDWWSLAGINRPSGLFPSMLTKMVDESNPRPGTADVFFAPDKVQALFSGVAVNMSVPAVRQLRIKNPFLDAMAILLTILLPGLPLYGGWQILKFDPRSPPVQRNDLRWINRILACGIIALGCYFGLQLIVLVWSQVISAMFGWSGIGYIRLWLPLAVMALAAPVATLAYGAVLCGVNLWRCQASSRVPLILAEGAGQGFMGAAALAAGLSLGLALLQLGAPLLMP